MNLNSKEKNFLLDLLINWREDEKKREGSNEFNHMMWNSGYLNYIIQDQLMKGSDKKLPIEDRRISIRDYENLCEKIDD